jgi:hypothetical protein
MKSYIATFWIISASVYIIVRTTQTSQSSSNDLSIPTTSSSSSLSHDHPMITHRQQQQRRRLEVEFEAGLKELKKYKQEHGDLLVSQGHVVVINGEEVKLGKWVQRLRQLYKNTYAFNHITIWSFWVVVVVVVPFPC